MKNIEKLAYLCALKQKITGKDKNLNEKVYRVQAVEPSRFE